MKIRSGGGGDDKKKSPTPEQIAAANAFAKNFGRRHHLSGAEYMHVGNEIPKFLDEYGKETVSQPTRLPPNTIIDINKVPISVKSLEWDSKENTPYYLDNNGYIQYVHPTFFHANRFQPNRGKGTNIIDYAKSK